MPSPGGVSTKICKVCGTDCAAKPRVKDSQGHYYCQPCYDAARVTAKPAAPPTKPPVKSAARSTDEPDVLLAFDELLSAEKQSAAIAEDKRCEKCRATLPPRAMVCPACGFNRQTGQAAAARAIAAAPSASPRKSSGGSISLPWKEPWALGLALVVVYGALFYLAYTDKNLAMPGFMVTLVLSLGVTIWLLVNAFGDGVGTGILCLCIAPYAIYYVLARNDNRHLRYAVIITYARQFLDLVFLRNAGLDLGLPNAP